MTKRERSEAPLVTVASALVEAQGDGKQGRLKVLEHNAERAILELEFATPQLSKSGKSYLVAYDKVKLGSLTITSTAYIGLGKDKGRRAGRVDDPEQNVERDSARRFYGEKR